MRAQVRTLLLRISDPGFRRGTVASASRTRTPAEPGRSSAATAQAGPYSVSRPLLWTALGTASLVGVLTFTNLASAGLAFSFPVAIDNSQRVASGSLGSAHNSGDSVQYIGCSNYVTGYYLSGGGSDAVQTSGACLAVDSQGNPAACVFLPLANPAVSIAQLPRMQSDSLISFTWDTNGYCTSVQSWVSGDLSPKQP